MESVRSKFLSGVIWTFIQNLGVKGLSFIFGIFLARILSPEDFGVVGMLTVFFTLSQVFIESGFGQALIQKPECTEADFSTAFYFNVTVAIAIYAFLFLLAPLVSIFYGVSELALVMRISSLNFVLGSINVVQRAKLTKEINFKPLSIISLAGTIIGGSIGILFALRGFGVWALVAQTLFNTLTTVILFPFFSKWHPKTGFRKESFQQLWRFGSKILISGILSAVIRNFANIIIGRFYDKEQVGYYSKAYTSAELPAIMMLNTIYNVSFPVLSKVQDDADRQLSIYKKILFASVLVVCPIIILISLLSEPLVRILLTDKWLPMIPLLQILLLARMMMPINAIHEGLICAKGHSEILMRLSLISGPITIIAIFASVPFGVKIMAFATLIAAIITYIITADAACRYTGYTILAQLYDWRGIVLSLLIMAAVVSVIIHIIENLWIKLVIGFISGVGIYLICCFIFKLVDKQLISDIKGLLSLRGKKSIE